ncbi:MAG TPA: MFS transporter [Trebonia sp.]|jgi:SET family sugar efflux transporter-like MFS transporter|nr:MFS transporter [Trebonia sp.]
MPGTPAGAVAAAQPSSLQATMRDPLYRGATIAMFLSGLGYSAAAPQIASFLVRDLGTSLTTAGLYYLTALTAPVAGYLIGSRSDRTGDRITVFRACALLGFLGWAGVAFSTQAWMPFAIGALVLGIAGTAGSQLFAAVHDQLSDDPAVPADGVISVVRMALTAGWVVGPVLGSYLAAAAGYRVLLAATALCTLAQVVPLGLRAPRRAAPAPDPEAARAGAAQLPRHHRAAVLLPLLTFTGLYVLVYAGEPVKYAYLPIYMRTGLHLAPVTSGAVIGIQPLIELALMPLSVLIARRAGIMRLMVAGAAFGVGANLCFATTASAAGMFAGQACMGAVWGVFAGLGIVVAQRLLPGAAATASAVFMSSTAVASALGGGTGAIAVATVGLPHVFFVPACYSLLAVAGLALMSASKHNVR